MDNAWITHRLVAAGHAPGDDAYVCRSDLQDREWLLTNGTGAYAMGTALGANTRRYHGLLVAATAPPVGRIVALHQVFDRLLLRPRNDETQPDGQEQDQVTQTVELSTGLFRDEQGDWVHAPQGHDALAEFCRGLTVRWTYRWGKITAHRELVLHDGEQAATIHYRIEGLKTLHADAALLVSPMLTLRDFHGLCRRDEVGDAFSLTYPKHRKKLTVRRGDTAATFSTDGGQFVEAPDWWFGVGYPRDAHRGQGDAEDHFVPGHFEFPLTRRHKADAAEVSFTVALGTRPAEPRRKPGRLARLKPTLKSLPGKDIEQKALALAADDFVVRRQVGDQPLSTILAGYPWFADWGRDTFISLTGLLLAAGRFEEARDVLRAFAGSIRHGLVPNRFDDYDQGTAHYNTVDASLWFVEAGLQYMTEAETRPRWLMEAIGQILDAYRHGTEAHGHDGQALPIAAADDDLITAGDQGSQLTWMDATCGGVTFTPRHGKCVEINALWYNALCGYSQILSDDDHGAAKDYADLASRVKRSFIRVFWSDEMKRLIDHVTPDGHADLSLRPNMVFACSLHDSPLSPALRKAVLASIKQSLYTPMGLRTLPCDDPRYHAHYGGPQFDRDEAYHQGTIWPWLMGPYAEGLLRAHNFSDRSRVEARTALTPLLHRLMGDGLGQLAEIHDAGEPHTPRGCPAQAWSVAELIRVLALCNC